jgi:hypothetical protein
MLGAPSRIGLASHPGISTDCRPALGRIGSRVKPPRTGAIHRVGDLSGNNLSARSVRVRPCESGLGNLNVAENRVTSMTCVSRSEIMAPFEVAG